jgi:hypothetical protein
MYRHVRRLLAMLAAAMTLALIVSSASAGRLSISNRQIRVTWASLEALNNITSETLRCSVTIEGSFHSATLQKVASALVGYVSRASVNRTCTGGSATIDQETLPWHLTYASFSGVLPSLTGVRLSAIGFSAVLAAFGNICRLRSEVAQPLGVIAQVAGEGRITGSRIDETSRIMLRNGPGGFACGLASGTLRGTGSFALLGTTTAVSIRLI